jgi:hypothetical protein
MANPILSENPIAGIDINRIVSVATSSVPVAIPTPNVNNIAFFTTQLPSNSDPYRSYVSYPAVIADYGTDADISNFSNVLFQQNPNITTAGGVLYAIPYQGAVSATSGSFITPDISDNIVNFQIVTDGAFTINIDGSTFDVINLNFTTVNTLQDIANIIQNYLQNVVVTVSVNSILFTSKKVGANSTIIISPQGSGTDLTNALYLNVSLGINTIGVDSVGETLPQAITRTMYSIQYSGIATNLAQEDAAVQAACAFVNGLPGKYLQNVISSLADINNLALPNAIAGQRKSRFFLYTDPSKTMQALAAGISLMAGVDYTGSFTTKTMQAKQVNGLAPDLLVYDALYPILDQAGCDYYPTVGGTAFAISTSGNDFADNVINDLALEFYCQYALFNFLRTTNTKVPQTEQGMIAAKNAVKTILGLFVANGTIAPGQWNSSQTFGNTNQFLNDIETLGYYIYSQPISQQLQSLRDNRIAPTIQVAAKRAGALQTFTLTALLEN